MFNKKRIALLSLLIIGSVSILYAIKEYYRKPEGIEQLKPDFTVSSTEFIRQYNNEQLIANKRYLGKTIVVNGKIKVIEKPDQKKLTIVLGEQGSSSAIRCNMDSSALQQSLFIKEENNISIKGICTGFIPDDMGLGADIILTKCIINEKK